MQYIKILFFMYLHIWVHLTWSYSFCLLEHFTVYLSWSFFKVRMMKWDESHKYRTNGSRSRPSGTLSFLHFAARWSKLILSFKSISRVISMSIRFLSPKVGFDFSLGYAQQLNLHILQRYRIQKKCSAFLWISILSQSEMADTRGEKVSVLFSAISLE